MVKNRKPLMVSDEARHRLKERAHQEKMFIGDVVDILVGVKSYEDVRKEYATEKRIKRKSWGLDTTEVQSP